MFLDSIGLFSFYKGIFNCCLQMPYKTNRGILRICYAFRYFQKLLHYNDVYKQYYLCHTGLLFFSSNYMNIWRKSQLNYILTYFYHLTCNSLVLCSSMSHLVILFSLSYLLTYQFIALFHPRFCFTL